MLMCIGYASYPQHISLNRCLVISKINKEPPSPPPPLSFLPEYIREENSQKTWKCFSYSFSSFLFEGRYSSPVFHVLLLLFFRRCIPLLLAPFLIFLFIFFFVFSSSPSSFDRPLLLLLLFLSFFSYSLSFYFSPSETSFFSFLLVPYHLLFLLLRLSHLIFFFFFLSHFFSELSRTQLSMVQECVFCFVYCLRRLPQGV